MKKRKKKSMSKIAYEAILKALETCQVRPPETRNCNECFYISTDVRCMDRLHRDAADAFRELIKKQESKGENHDE